MDRWVREEDPFKWEDKEEKAIARWAPYGRMQGAGCPPVSLATQLRG